MFGGVFDSKRPGEAVWFINIAPFNLAQQGGLVSFDDCYKIWVKQDA